MHASMNGDRSFFNNDSDSLEMQFDCFAIIYILSDIRNMCICRIEISLLFFRLSNIFFLFFFWMRSKKSHDDDRELKNGKIDKFYSHSMTKCPS